jgi:hypothetical protein
VTRWRFARRLLDPWAGLLVAALVVLGVVILLATPAPWRVVGGPQAPVSLVPSPPSDIAVFILAGPDAARCTATLWLHVEYRSAGLTVVVVPPESRCAVEGGGYAPLRRLVTDLGPRRAGEALGDALSVSFDGWMTLDRVALGRLLSAAHAPGEGRRDLLDFRTVTAALSRVPLALESLAHQHDALARCLRALPYDRLNANAVVNFMLGSDNVGTDLDLRAATALVRTFGALRARDVAVRTAAAIVETCGTARSWRLDESRLEPLRRSLSLGLKAPAGAPRIALQERAAEVLVVAPPGPDDGLARSLQAALRGDAAGPLSVVVRSVGGEGSGERLAALLARRRPLAVVLAPWPGTSASELLAQADALRRASQPAILLAPPAETSPELTDAVAATGLPLAGAGAGDVGPTASSDEGTPGSLPAGAARAPAPRLVAATLARACWPDYLAPDLIGTRLEFSYAARRHAEVAVSGSPSASLLDWLEACGYQVAGAVGAEQPASLSSPAIAYLPGARRSAQTLAGDLGWGAATLTRDPDAPRELTLVTGRD